MTSSSAISPVPFDNAAAIRFRAARYFFAVSSVRSTILASIAAFLTASMPFSLRLVGYKTPHSGNGIVRLDSHIH
jgi:hypothetical protein